MVYDKKRSGDPDYDDKQPPEFHAGGVVVSAGDGVILSPATGPVDAEGAHVNLAVGTEDLDNRPSPGNVATAPSTVQDYDAEDTPTVAEPTQADQADLDHVEASQASVQVAHAQTVGLAPDAGQADESHTRTADITAAKGENASAARKPASGTASK